MTKRSSPARLRSIPTMSRSGRSIRRSSRRWPSPRKARAHRRVEAPHRRHSSRRHRRPHRRAGETLPCGGRGRRLRRHRHHAERRAGGARERMDRRDARGVTRIPIALTIAGSDSGGGAGIQADLKTFAALGVYGASVVTALTAQNTRGVRAIHFAPPDIVAAQIDAVMEDFAVAAIKIGMLGSAEIAEVVAERLGLPSPQPSPAKRGEGAAPTPGEGGAEARPDEGLHRLRPRHDRLLGRRAERRGLRRGGQDEAAAAGRLPDPQSRRGGGAARRAGRSKRRRHGAAGPRAGRARARRRADERRASRTATRRSICS